jgi:glycerol uptake facilitator-like aquaporin
MLFTSLDIVGWLMFAGLEPNTINPKVTIVILVEEE